MQGDIRRPEGGSGRMRHERARGRKMRTGMLREQGECYGEGGMGCKVPTGVRGIFSKYLKGCMNK